MLTTLAIEGYRSLRRLVLPMRQLNVGRAGGLHHGGFAKGFTRYTALSDRRA